MAENKRLSEELTALGGGIAGATIGRLLLDQRVLEVKLFFPRDQVGRVVFGEVESVQFWGPSDAVLSGGAVLEADELQRQASGREFALWKHVLYGDEGQAVLEVVAESFSLTELLPDRGWTKVVRFWERNWDPQGPEVWTKALEAFPPGYRGAICIEWIDTEHRLLGFASILGNTTRRIFEHSIACYQRLEQPRMATILQSALIVSGSETPDLWEVPPTPAEFGLVEPLVGDLDELDRLYSDERELLPIADGLEDETRIMGTIEYYWRTFPDDFQPAPDEGRTMGRSGS